MKDNWGSRAQAETAPEPGEAIEDRWSLHKVRGALGHTAISVQGQCVRARPPVEGMHLRETSERLGNPAMNELDHLDRVLPTPQKGGSNGGMRGEKRDAQQ